MRARTRTPSVLLGLAIQITLATCGCRHHEESHSRTSTPVRVHTVGEVADSRGVRYSATIEPYEQVSLAFKVSGYVREILQARGLDGRERIAGPGDRVTRGTVLARIRPDDYRERVRQSTSELSRAQASLEKARHDWERASNLYASASLTKPEYDAAKASFESAQASAAGAKSQRDEAQMTLDDSALVAPIDGVIVERRIESGTLAQPGTIAFVVADLSRVKAVFGVPEGTLSRLAVGAALPIANDSLPGGRVEGRVSAISPSADAHSRVFEVELTVDNPDERLKAGMIASLEIPGERSAAPSGLSVPFGAVIRSKSRPDGYAVVVVEEQGGGSVARFREIEVGEVIGNTIRATSGLKPGDRVVVTGTTLVTDGDAVVIVK